MKKIIIIFLAVFAFGEIEGLKPLLENIFPLITHKHKVKIFTVPKYYNLFNSRKFIIVRECEKSDIVFGDFICDDRPTFTLNYYFYKTHKNAIGAFYYRKGRPQLKFKKEGLIRFFKSVPSSLKDFTQ